MCLSIIVNSSHLSVISGVPQGSILGPLLFLVYINDLPESVDISRLFLFADDTKLLKSIDSINDFCILQSDIDSLQNWSLKWHLLLHPDKSVAMRYTLCPSHAEVSPYTINGNPVKFSKSHRDLGVLVSEDLSWSKHINSICSKAYKSLYFIRRLILQHSSTALRRQLYLTLVRSHLGYCSQLWRPFLVKDILHIEQIQRRASKYILNDFNSDYKSRLIELNILPLSYWFEFLDLSFLIKSMKVPADNLTIYPLCLHQHDQQIITN